MGRMANDMVDISAGPGLGRLSEGMGVPPLRPLRRMSFVRMFRAAVREKAGADRSGV